MKTEEQSITSVGGCLARVFWLLLGPGLLLVCGIVIATQRFPFPSVADAIFGIFLILCVAARLVDRPKPSTPPSDQSAINQETDSKFQTELRAAIAYCITLALVALAFRILVHFMAKSS